MNSQAPPPRPKTLEDLDFQPFQRMVRWFTPSELVRAGVKSVLSSLFGSYADQRELQALQALPEGELCFDYSEQEELWIDYVSDLGDGWDPTYTIASLLAQPQLSLRYAEDGVEQVYVTQRGRVLVMGGDQVYPTATRDEYQTRLVGPYRAALPYVAQDPPDLFAVPGNHDWYDGLTSFMRHFCQGRWIGAWRTRQRRSYFALKLPYDWWLWGIDVQLESDVDLPQYNFFHALASNPAVMKPGSKIILCTPEPSWVFLEQSGPRAYHNLEYFETHLIEAYGHEHVIGLAGDLHTYARYERPEDGKQRFIAGGGGAYLYPTHDLPQTLRLPDNSKPSQPAAPPATGRAAPRRRAPRTQQFERKGVFPDVRTSRGLALRSLLFAWDNKRFGLFLGAVYLFIAWVIQSISGLTSVLTGTLPGEPPEAEQDSLLRFMAEHFGLTYVPDVLDRIWTVVAHSPGTTFILVLLVAGFYGFADSKKPPVKLGLGLFHAALHVMLLFVMMACFAYLNWILLPQVLPWVRGSVWQLLLFAAEMVVIGGFLGAMAMGLYLFLANLVLGVHSNEVLLCQSLPDYKHFVRLHVTRDGVTIYPVGVRRVPRKWVLKPEGAPGDPWFEPVQGPVSRLARLIERPILVPRRVRTERSVSRPAG